ncbi:MAG TPA: hypothetical protein PKE06_26360 [Flavilitoribacter sp.]|nr:hypothetical protein [Flavilitoribacter sp.]HMQ90205.1 hypothetical protein [Flavilitoribacter sp.]
MQTITVELLNEKALILLQQLEQLNILRLVSNKDKTEVTKRKWAGSLSKETAEKMLHELDKSRDEWERNI